MPSFKMKFSGVTILQGFEFSIFPIDFEWALRQCSATALPVICIERVPALVNPVLLRPVFFALPAAKVDTVGRQNMLSCWPVLMNSPSINVSSRYSLYSSTTSSSLIVRHTRLSAVIDRTVTVADVMGRLNLRSATRGLLNFLRYNMTSYGRRAFSYAGPHASNSLHARTFARNHINRTFQALSKNVFIRADIALSALETFLLNGLYKFTYLLTYLYNIVHHPPQLHYCHIFLWFGLQVRSQLVKTATNDVRTLCHQMKKNKMRSLSSDTSRAVCPRQPVISAVAHS